MSELVRDCLLLISWAQNKSDLIRGYERLDRKYPGHGFGKTAEKLKNNQVIAEVVKEALEMFPGSHVVQKGSGE